MLRVIPSQKSSLSWLASRVASSFSNIAAIQKNDAPVDIHPEVQEALAANKPVVALETALVTHGFPYPDNLKLATSLENIVRSTGSVPATIGIIGGRVKVGLNGKHLERLASNDSKPAKVSRRDIAPAIAMKSDGGTTCSATLIFSALAGIKVFSTGGLGGVHRGGENSMDVSADLNELTRCPVGLVSSGVKSILDIGRTLEYLETLGVPVLTYGISREFPAFFSRSSGFQAPWQVNDPVTAAQILYTQWQFGMNNGALFAVPIPSKFEAAGLSIQKAVDQAVAESEQNGVSKRGKEATPWLLHRVGELTQGSSRASNVALLENTALVGGQIAAEYQKLTSKPYNFLPSTIIKTSPPLLPADLVVVGSSAIDITAQAAEGSDASLAIQSTVPGVVSTSLGGVARNMAEAAHRVICARAPRSSSLLVSPIGDDAFGRLLVEETKRIGMRDDGLIMSSQRTAVCSMKLDNNGSLVGGVADMDIVASMDGHTVVQHIQKQRPRLIALDGNLSPECINIVIGYCQKNSIEVFYEPTSRIKASAILPSIAASLDTLQTRAPVAFSSPNIPELVQLLIDAENMALTSHPTYWQVIDGFALKSAFRSGLEGLAKNKVSEEDSAQGTLSFLVDDGIAQMSVKLLPFFQRLVVKCGPRGAFVAMRLPGTEAELSPWFAGRNQSSQRRITARGTSNEIIVMQHFPPHRTDVINVTGAGDSFVGSLLASLVEQPDTFRVPDKLENAMFLAQSAAAMTLQSHRAVSPLLSNQ